MLKKECGLRVKAWSHALSAGILQMVPHEDEPVEFHVNDKVFYYAGDLTVPAWPDSGMDMRQSPLGPGSKQDDAMNDDAEDQDDNPMNGKEEKTSGVDLGASERDLLEHQFSGDDDSGDVDGPLVLMTPSSFISPTKEAQASLSPAAQVYLELDSQGKGAQKLLHESPRRKRFDETMIVSFLSTLPVEEWERYQSELELQMEVTWNRVAFMERTCDVICRYWAQSVMKVVLNQPIMRTVLGKLIAPLSLTV